MSSYTCSVLHQTPGATIEDVRYSQTGNFMLVCDSDYVHLWKFEAGGAETPYPNHVMRIKSNGARCIALSGNSLAQVSESQMSNWCCAWGCVDGRVHFFDSTSQQHSLYIPSQPLHISPGGLKERAGILKAGIVAIGFVFSHLVLCGDERGSLSLLEFGQGQGPRVVQFIGMHQGKRYISNHYCYNFEDINNCAE